jgi:hypothetical protein
MARPGAPTDRFNGKPSAWTALCATIFYLPLAIWKIDFGPLLYSLLAAIAVFVAWIIAIVLAIRRQYRRCLSAAAMIVAICATSSVLLSNTSWIHTCGRWITHGPQYRAAVLAQPTPAAGDLKHVEWDGWGWGGNGTTVYLVFDPGDSLASAAKNHSTGRISRALCGVSRMQRLENHWYSVVFYTDTAWGDCS